MKYWQYSDQMRVHRDRTVPHTHLAMIISQLLCPDNPVQIRLHKFLNDCDRGGREKLSKGWRGYRLQ